VEKICIRATQDEVSTLTVDIEGLFLRLVTGLSNRVVARVSSVLWIGLEVIHRLTLCARLPKVGQRRTVRIQDIWSGMRVREVTGKIWSSGFRENVEAIWNCRRVR